MAVTSPFTSSRRALSALAIAFAACVLGGSAGRAAEARIGTLTLPYDEVDWRVEGGGEAFVFTCLTESCGRSVIDVAVEPRPDGHCDEDEVLAVAEAAFPFADRHPVNTYRVGVLAMVMSESRNGSAFDVPSAVAACITRGGAVYHFRSRAGVYPVHAGNILHRLLYTMTADPAATVEMTVGAVTFSYPDDRWRRLDGTGMLSCLPPTCEDWKPSVGISVEDGSPDCFPTAADTGLDVGTFIPLEEIEAGQPERRLVFRVGMFGTMCRNWTPPKLVACAVHNGQTYRLSTSGPQGCKSFRDVPDEAFLALVASARVAP